MANLDDLRLYVRYDEGDGPVMVLLHGINSDAKDWRQVIDTIGGGYRFVAVDLLGFGESPKPTDIEYTADEHTRVLDATLADIGVDRPVLMVGYSLGGDIAIRYASTHPRKVRRLFLLSAPFYLPPNVFSRQAFGTQYLQVIIFQRLWKFVSNSKKRDNLLYQIVDGKAQDFAKGFLHTDDIPTHWDIMSKNLRNCIGKATFVDDLPKLDMPVTFALGIRDPIVHPDQTPELKRLKPDMDIRRIVGLSADHFLLVNLPDTVADEIMRDEVDTLCVRYRAGTGSPIVFLNGFIEGAEFWRPVAQALSLDHDVLMIDLLGLGESPRPLSSRYEMEDHVDTILRTLRKELTDEPARLVGFGFGSNVALAVATAEPGRVTEVTAFSPLILDPKELADPSSPEAAEMLTMRDRLSDMADDPRTRAAAENAEEIVVPVMRTIDNAILGQDNRRLITGPTCPVTIVIADTDPMTDPEYLAGLARGRDSVRIEKMAGPRQLPIDDPSAVVLLLEPGAVDQARAAARLPRPEAGVGLDQMREVFSSASNGVLWRGFSQFVVGMVFLLMQKPRPQLFAFVFAIWILVEGFSTIVGAVGLRRSGKTGWIPWLLMGLLSLGVAGFLLLRTQADLVLLGLFLAGRALYVGFADLYVARRVSRTPTARWLLVGQGILGIVVAFLIVFSPGHGFLALKWILGTYFTVTGLSSVGYAILNRRAVRRRIKAALAKSRAVAATATG